MARKSVKGRLNSRGVFTAPTRSSNAERQPLGNYKKIKKTLFG